MATAEIATKRAPVKVAGSAIHAAFGVMAPLVEAALPAAGDAPKTAREIFNAIGVGRIGTVRIILRGIAAEGRAVAIVEAVRHGDFVNLYRRAPEAACPSP